MARPSPTSWAAAGFAALAALALLLEVTTDALDGWAANAAIEAAAIAVTVAIVERIVRREARERARRRADRAIRWTAEDFALFMETVVLDYVMTHEETWRPLQGDALAVLDQWLDDHDRQDTLRNWIAGDDMPLLANAGLDFANGLRRFREGDLDVLDDDLAHVMDDFAARAVRATHAFGMTSFFLDRDSVAGEREALREVVVGARNFAVVFRRFAPDAMRLSEASRRAAEAMHERRVGRRRRAS